MMYRRLMLAGLALLAAGSVPPATAADKVTVLLEAVAAALCRTRIVVPSLIQRAAADFDTPQT